MEKPLYTRLPHHPVSRKSDLLLAGFFSSIHVILTTIVYHYVPEPYMDEIFHIGQTRSYCQGNYTWNPLITTPPALYILSIPFCGYERYVNSILMFFAVLAFCRFRRIFCRSDVWLTVSIVSLLPILLHSSLLFYTDLLSLTAVMWGFSIANPIISAIFFTISTLCRQTNIIWAAIYAMSYLIMTSNPKHRISSFFNALLTLWPFELLAIGFATFIYFNNFQIVLGDAKAHQPKFHVAQFLYMFAFSTAHAWPKVLKMAPEVLRESINVKSIILLPLICLGVNYFSYDHPYLLADNRHFTFYIWRRFLSKPTLRVAIAPAYLFAFNFMSLSTRQINPIFKSLFIFACFVVLVPAHLFEMRYYIIPYVIWRLAVDGRNDSKLLVFLELCSQILIFTFVFYLFLFKPFVWENEPQALQRFMF